MVAGRPRGSRRAERDPRGGRAGRASRPFAVAASPAGGIAVVLWQDWNADGRVDAGDTPYPYFAPVYLDLNDNGKFEVREPHLYGPDPDGVFRFTNLAAEAYAVRVDTSPDKPQTLPAGRQAHRVTVSATSIHAPAQFLIATPALIPPRASVAGRVFEDRDRDGRRDPGDVGVKRVTVWLDADRDGAWTRTSGGR